MSRGRISVTSIVFVCLSAGCSILAPQPDRTRIFVLRPVAEANGGASIGKTTLGVGPVTLPGYLSRPQIVRRSGETQLRVSQTEIWGEPLDRNFASAVSENLGQLLGTVDIIRYPWFASTQVDYQIPIEVLRFEADENGTVYLDARWWIRQPMGKQLLSSTESSFVEKAAMPSTEAVVAAMSEAAGKLSIAVATEIRRLKEGEFSRQRTE